MKKINLILTALLVSMAGIAQTTIGGGAMDFSTNKVFYSNITIGAAADGGENKCNFAIGTCVTETTQADDGTWSKVAWGDMSSIINSNSGNVAMVDNENIVAVRNGAAYEDAGFYIKVGETYSIWQDLDVANNTYTAFMFHNDNDGRIQLETATTVNGVLAFRNTTAAPAYWVINTDAGKHTVVVTVNDVAAVPTVGDMPASLNDRVENKVKVFVSNGTLNIIGTDNAVSMKMFNISGQLVKSFDNVNSSVNISDVNSGLYVVEMNDNNTIIKQKIMID